jgi:hypothetical protein
MEKNKKRAAKKERELKQKSDLRQKMSVIATSTGIDNDEELHMPQRLWDEIRESGLEKLDESMSSGSDSNESSDESDESDLDSDVDDKRMAIERMAEDMETNITR